MKCRVFAPRTLGRERVGAYSWEYPLSSEAYSGLPLEIFGRLLNRDRLAFACSMRPSRRAALRRNLVGLKKLFFRRTRANPIWRYDLRNMDWATQRLSTLIPRDCWDATHFQFGVGGVPPGEGPLVAHVEYPVRYAVENPFYSQGYGFDQITAREMVYASEGERRFLWEADLIWTNSEFTKSLFDPCFHHKIRTILPVGLFARSDFGSGCQPKRENILFVGRNWKLKGGDEVVAAFRHVQERCPTASLTIIGCRPACDLPEGTRVLGRIDVQTPAGRERLRLEFEKAAVFVMPSSWESTGMVFIEAAAAGLPVIMKRIPETSELFSESPAIQLDVVSPEVLSQEILNLLLDRELQQNVAVAQQEYWQKHWSRDGFFKSIDALLEEAAKINRVARAC